MANPPPLNVRVRFPTHTPPTDASITIRFVEVEHAKRYYDYLTKTHIRFHEQYNLRASRREKSITMRLPTRFNGISASVRCKGFFFTVSEGYIGFAQDWVRTLKLWSFLEESSTEVFVMRDWFQHPSVVEILDPDRERRRGKGAELGPVKNNYLERRLD